MLVINGKDAPDAAGRSLAEYLTSQGYVQERLAVERNGDIVPKAEYSRTILQDGDKVEIVRFVGGG